MKIGFIGLGSLGTPIAINIIERQHGLYVYNRTVSKTAVLADKGAIVCETIASLAQQVDIVFTMVSDDKALEQVSLGENGLISNLRSGSVHISMSTILPETADKLAKQHAQREQHYLAAPVFGRPEAAVLRKLSFVVSGAEEIRNSAEPLLKDAGAAGIWHFGDAVTAANTVKLCGNFLIGGALQAIGESIRLATGSGIDARQMWDLFTQTIFSSPVYQNYSRIILDKKFEPAAFTATLGLKDLTLVLQQAASVDQPMPLAELVRSNLQQLVSSGHGDTDWSALSTSVDKNSQ